MVSNIIKLAYKKLLVISEVKKSYLMVTYGSLSKQIAAVMHDGQDGISIRD